MDILQTDDLRSGSNCKLKACIRRASVEIYFFFHQKHPQLIDEPSWHLWKQAGNKGLLLFTCHKLCPSQLSHLCVWMSVLTLYPESFDLWLMTTRIIRLLRKNNVLTQQLQRLKLTVLINGVQVPTAPWKISDQLNTCSQLHPKTKCSLPKKKCSQSLKVLNWVIRQSTLLSLYALGAGSRLGRCSTPTSTLP